MTEQTHPPKPKPSISSAFGMLLQPLVAPRIGFPRFLLRDEIDSFPLFSALMAYFVASLIYTIPLRHGAGIGMPELSPRAITGLFGAIPFIVSLVIMSVIIIAGAGLWIIAKLLGSQRPYGHWMGLAAFASLPGVLRLLIEAVLLEFGGTPGVFSPANPVLWFVDVSTIQPSVLTLLYSFDPFLIWSLVVIAAGFAIYAAKPLWMGALVAIAFWGLQLALGLQLTTSAFSFAWYVS